MKILRHGYAVKVTEEMTPAGKWDRVLIPGSNSTTCSRTVKEEELDRDVGVLRSNTMRCFVTRAYRSIFLRKHFAR